MYKHKFLSILILSIFLCISCSSFADTSDDESFAKPELEPAEAIEQADELYKKRGDLDNARKALKTLQKARDLDNRDYNVEWKYAKISYFIGNDYDTPDDEAETVLKKGLTAAKIAKRMEPNKPEGNFWYGAVLGEQARRSPITVGSVSIGEIKKSMQKVIEIEPSFQGASAYDALGILELKTIGLAGGSKEKAVEYLEEALELEKQNSYIRLHLAEAYLAVDKDKKAKEQLDFLLQMTPDEDYIPEHERSIIDAKKLLKDKF